VDFLFPGGIFIIGSRAKGWYYVFEILIRSGRAATAIRPAFTWILELAEHTQQRLIRLREVRIIEKVEEGWNKVIDFGVPTELEMAFRAACVTLHLQLRRSIGLAPDVMCRFT
jgi:hypothetical protein